MESRQKFLSALLLLFTLGLLYLYAWPRVVQAYNDFLSLRQKNKELADLNTLISQKEAFRRKLDDFRATNALLFQAIPERFSESETIATISGLARVSGSALTLIDLRKPDDKGLVGLHFALAGRQDAMRSFLTAMGKTFPLIDLVGTRLEASDKVETFTIDAQTYVMPKAPEMVVSYDQLLKQLEEALATKADILKDDRLKGFNAVSEIPLPLPSKDAVGGRDPLIAQ